MEFLFSVCYGPLLTGKPLSLANGQGLFGLTEASAVLEDKTAAYTYVMLAANTTSSISSS